VMFTRWCWCRLPQGAQKGRLLMCCAHDSMIVSWGVLLLMQEPGRRSGE
jgi:hypothetical protein